MNGTDRVRPGTQEPRPPQFEGEEPLGSLLRKLSRDAYRLIAQQFELARSEISAKILRTFKDSTFLVIGASTAYAGFLLILSAVVMALARVIPIGLAAFLVGITVVSAGVLLMAIGRRRLRHDDLVPRKTIEVLEGDKRWIRDRMS